MQSAYPERRGDLGRGWSKDTRRGGQWDLTAGVFSELRLPAPVRQRLASKITGHPDVLMISFSLDWGPGVLA